MFYSNVPIGTKLYNVVVSMKLQIPIILITPVQPTRSGIMTPTLENPFARAQSVSTSMQDMIDRAAASRNEPEESLGLGDPFSSPLRRDSGYTRVFSDNDNHGGLPYED